MLGRLPVQDRMGVDAGPIGLLKKSMYRTRHVASNRERDRQEHLKSWGYQLGLFRHAGHRVSGMTQGDDFVVTGPTDRLCRSQEHNCRGVPNQNKSQQFWVNRQHQSVEEKGDVQVHRAQEQGCGSVPIKNTVHQLWDRQKASKH